MRHLLLVLLALAAVASLGLAESTQSENSKTDDWEQIFPSRKNSTDAPPNTIAPATPTNTPGKAIPSEVIIPLKRNELHRIPVFEDRPENPPVETISNLDSLARNVAKVQQQDSVSSTTTTATQVDKNQASKQPIPKSQLTTTMKPPTSAPFPTFHLPIPSNCPAITGTEEKEDGGHEDHEDMKQLLDPASYASATQRGCRFFIMNELMMRTRAMKDHEDHDHDHDEPKHAVDEAALIRQMLRLCFDVCNQAYDNGTQLSEACATGCRKTALSVQAAKGLDSLAEDDQLEREEGHDAETGLRTFSIIITQPPAEEPETSDNSGRPVLPPAVRMMLSMMAQLAERTRESFAGQNTEDGKAMSVSNRVSIVMSKDKDGHSKMVVVHSVPRVKVFSAGSRLPSIFDDEDEDDLKDPFDKEVEESSKSSSHSASSDSEDDDESDNMFDTEAIRVRLFGHASRDQTQSPHLLGENGHGQRQTPKHKPVYYYRSKLCYYLPRLFYLTLVILVLYIIFWLFCAVPAAFYGRNRAANRRGAGANSGGGVAIIATNGGGKSKKFFFTKNQKYFQLNNNQKRLSTTSLPPPYPGYEDQEAGAESCAEPLPEKQPLPSTTPTPTSEVKN